MAIHTQIHSTSTHWPIGERPIDTSGPTCRCALPPHSTEKRAPVELHDLKPDPVQAHNLAYDLDYRHVRRRLRDRLHQHQLLDI